MKLYFIRNIKVYTKIAITKNKYIKQAPDTNAFYMLRKYCLFCCIYNILRETCDITMIQTFKIVRYYLFEFNNSVKYFPNRKR